MSFCTHNNAISESRNWVIMGIFLQLKICLLWVLGRTLCNSGFEVICYSSISKRPIFCDPYESFSFFRMSLECLDLEQIKFKFPFLFRFKITPPFQQHFYTAFWFVNNNLKNLLWFSVFWIIHFGRNWLSLKVKSWANLPADKPLWQT